jgi:hypothetical protein
MGGHSQILSDGQGFKHVADKVHNMGLKFGIHVMRGISLAAVDKNTLILNAKVHLLSHHYFLSLLMILGFILEFQAHHHGSA